MKIVAFGHESGVGKDTAARFLIGFLRSTRKGLSVQKRSLASKLKAVAHDLYAWAGLKDEAHYEVDREARKQVLPALGKTPVQVWIDLSQAINERVYDATLPMYLLNNNGCGVAVITDLRTPQEANIIRKRGGLLFKVQRRPELRDVVLTDRNVDGLLDDYSSWDGVIVNESDMDHLYEEVVTKVVPLI